MTINKKLLVVSGGTKGIGRAIAERFAVAGFDICTCARNKENLREMKLEMEEKYQGIAVDIFPADLSESSQVKDFVRHIEGKKRRVDVLINNAGLFLPGSIHDEPEGNLDYLLRANLMSAYHLTRGVITRMKEEQKGHIFFISSTAGLMAYSNGGSYSVTKHAMTGLAKAIREEMKQHGVRVTTLFPGAVYTASWEGANLPEERFMKSEDIAELVYNAWMLSARTVVEEILVRPQLGDL